MTRRARARSIRSSRPSRSRRDSACRPCTASCDRPAAPSRWRARPAQARASTSSCRRYTDAASEVPTSLVSVTPALRERVGPAVVLVVEDEASVLRLVRRVLESEAMVVLSAQDAEEALLLTSQHGGVIDLLLTDVVMPGLNGLELAQRVMAERPHLRVLFMSGYADHAVVQRDIIDAGRPFLQKPFAPDRLVARVKEVLAMRLRMRECRMPECRRPP